MKLGIDIGGSHIGLALIDDNFKIISKKEIDLPKDKSNIKDFLVRVIKDGILSTNNEISLIGICSPRNY